MDHAEANDVLEAGNGQIAVSSVWFPILRSREQVLLLPQSVRWVLFLSLWCTLTFAGESLLCRLILHGTTGT